jgi:hypothetical protein
MTGATNEIQWYIARDGKQHGPISDVEMRTFVDLGHLKPTDLVWRAGFPDWRPSPMVFPAKPAAPPPRPTPPQRVEPPTQPRPEPVTAGTGQAGAPSATGTATAMPAAVASAQAAAPQPRVGPEMRAPAPQGSLAQPAPATPTAGRTAPSPAIAPRPQEPARPMPVQPAPFFPLERHGAAEDEDIAEAEPSGRGFKIAALVVVLVLLGSGGMLAYQFRDRLVEMALGTGDTAQPAVVRAPDTPARSAAGPPAGTEATGATAGAAAAAATTIAAVDSAAAGNVDARLQKSQLWTVAKREFPDWYQARVAEVARLETQPNPGPATARYLVEQLVQLRRSNADAALAASHSRLKSIATAFLDNLTKLSEHGAETCYGFISQGETNPRVVELYQSSPLAGPIELQAAAILEAIAEGRKAPSQHMRPQKPDYDLLAAQLTKLGWSQADMQLFSDPKALARAEPVRICKMVQDWFRAHIAVPDAAVQERLLFETLRPVVAG